MTTFMTSPSLLFTSESVTEGHPDKMCDQISDAVLDAIFAQDPTARVACETAIKTGFVMCLGEITTNAFVNFDDLVRQVVKEIGFDSSEKGFDGNTCGVQIAIASQSPDIAMGVNEALMGGGGYWQNSDFYNTQYKIITSKVIADQVVAELKLKDKFPFKDSSDPSGLFLTHVSVEPVPESRLTYITVSHEDPQEAALWANRVADVYIRHSLEQRVESAR